MVLSLVHQYVIKLTLLMDKKDKTMLLRLRRVLMALSLVTLVGSIVLLLNFTAPNPTGRRYSSAMPLVTGQARNQDIGLSGERILAADLRLPRNEDPDQRQCICNSSGSYKPPVGECRVCYAYTQTIADYRRPDFVAPGFIAEAKNRQNFPYTERDQVEQISDYALAAKALGVPLWLYVRVNTEVAPEFYHLVRETGGDVVAYFTVPGYADPVDYAAQRSALVSGLMLVVLGVWEFTGRRASRTVTIPAAPPKSGKPPSSPRPFRPADAADDFMQRSKDRARGIIDREDSRSEMD